MSEVRHETWHFDGWKLEDLGLTIVHETEISARIAELEAALDSKHAVVGSNIWRFWSDKARDMAGNLTKARTRMAAQDAVIAELVEVLEASVTWADSYRWAADWVDPARAVIVKAKGEIR